MNRPSLCLICLFLSACASPGHWTRPGTTTAQFEQDKKECFYEARKALAGYGSSRDSPRDINQSIGQGIAQGIGQAWETRDLAVECMKVRGYVLERE